MISNTRLMVLAASAALLTPILMGNTASADPIGPDNCGSCLGVKYTLENLGNQDGGSATFDIWRIKLTADTTAYTGLDADWFDSISFKVFSNSITGVSLFGTNAPGTWAPGKGNTNNCGTQDNGFACAKTTDDDAVTDGSTYFWTLDVTIAEGTAFIDPAHIQISYTGINPSNDKVQNVGNTSEDIQLQVPGPNPISAPEPVTLALFGIGLAGLGLYRNRRRSA